MSYWLASTLLLLTQRKDSSEYGRYFCYGIMRVLRSLLDTVQAIPRRLCNFQKNGSTRQEMASLLSLPHNVGHYQATLLSTCKNVYSCVDLGTFQGNQYAPCSAILHGLSIYCYKAESTLPDTERNRAGLCTPTSRNRCAFMCAQHH